MKKKSWGNKVFKEGRGGQAGARCGCFKKGVYNPLTNYDFLPSYKIISNK